MHHPPGGACRQGSLQFALQTTSRLQPGVAAVVPTPATSLLHSGARGASDRRRHRRFSVLLGLTWDLTLVCNSAVAALQRAKLTPDPRKKRGENAARCSALGAAMFDPARPGQGSQGAGLRAGPGYCAGALGVRSRRLSGRVAEELGFFFPTCSIGAGGRAQGSSASS